MRTFIIVLLSLLLIAGCTGSREVEESNPENLMSVGQSGVPSLEDRPVSDVSFTTDDGVDIAASYFEGSGEDAVILVHMAGKDRHSWLGFPETLRDNGYSVLSLDLRGHGDSALDYNGFGDADWKNAVNDIKAGKDFLSSKKLVARLYIIGASIGANLALDYAASDADINGVGLLSPGADYHGISLLDKADNYIPRPILVAASQSDIYSHDSAWAIEAKMKPVKPQDMLIIYAGSAHGTDMFDGNPLGTEILHWLALQ